MRRLTIVASLSLSLMVVLSACAGPGQQAGANTGQASTAILPKEMQAAPARVRVAYQFAVSHPDALKNVPCYCGCGAMGHTSNLSCYIKERKPDGQIAFDEHALGCSLCVDISQDVMRMTGEGKSPQAIRASIVDAYGKFGPANQ
ncbi:MAG TPA: PCYCGC motif-containing (lipo)protein [Anaerolineae bacterium]